MNIIKKNTLYLKRYTGSNSYFLALTIKLEMECFSWEDLTNCKIYANYLIIKSIFEIIGKYIT